MKKFLTVLTIFTFVAVLFASCSKEDAPIVKESFDKDDSSQKVTFKSAKIRLKANFEEEGTKTELGGSDLNRVKWLPNERISLFFRPISYDDFNYSFKESGNTYWVDYDYAGVQEGRSDEGIYYINYFPGTNGVPQQDVKKSYSYKFTSTNSEVTSDYVEFEGIIEKFTTTSSLPKNKQIVALYPRNAKASLTTTVSVVNNITGNWRTPYSGSATVDTVSQVLTTSLPAFQVAKENSFADSLNISVATGYIYAQDEEGDVLNGDLYFHNVLSGFCFTVTHDDITAVELEGLNGEDLAGDLNISIEKVGEEKLPIVKSIDNPQKTVTVYAPNGTFVPGQQYYIMIAPVTFTNGIIITGLRADGKGYESQITKAGGITFNRSKFVRKKNFDNGLTATDVYTYTFDGTSPDDFPYYEKSNSYTVKSYRTRISTGNTQPMAWKVQVSTDSGSSWNDLTEANKSSLGVDWLTFSPLGYTNQTTGFEEFTITAAESDFASSTVLAETYHAAELSSRVAQDYYEGVSENMSGKAAAIDLSLYDVNGNLIPGGRSTANCYVVKAPGWYKIPLIYGNAVKNGAVNSKAYTAANSGYEYPDNKLVKFVVPDHLSQIGGGVDALNNGTVTEAEAVWVSKRIKGINRLSILWQDSENLIQNLALLKGDLSAPSWNERSEKYAYFFLSKNYIKQGNAVITARVKDGDEDYIAWSWHIWVTDQDFTPIDVINQSGTSYQFMPVNLGWTAVGDRIDYADREAIVRICQVGSGYFKEFTVIQHGKEGVEPSGNQPFYQWGRKDPQLASNGFDNIAKDYWGESGTWSGAPTGTKNDGTFTIKDDMVAKPGEPGLEDYGNFQAQKRLSLYAKNPAAFNITKFNGVVAMDARYPNLWSIEAVRIGDGYNNLLGNDNVVYKTIYDPTPYGFVVPVSGAFTGFTTETIGNLTYQGGANTEVADGYGRGFYFYTTPAKDATIFFPLTGIRRQSNGTWAALEEEGYYWTAQATYSADGFSFQFGGKNSKELVSGENYDNGTNYVMLRTNIKGTGYAIRPMIDKTL